MKLLPEEARKYIKTTSSTYSQITKTIETRWGRKVSKGTVSYYRGSRAGRSKTAKLREISPSDWDWLIGLYYADGCKFKDKWRHAVVFSISLSEKALLEKLLRLLRAIGLSPSLLTRTGWRGINIRAYNKDLFGALPDKWFLYYPTVPLAFVAGLVDGDGYMCRRKGTERWEFAQAKYPHLVCQFQEIVSNYGHTSTYTYPRREGWLPLSRVSILKDARDRLTTNEFAQNSVRLAMLHESNSE